MTFLSDKNIPPAERLIVALDLESAAEARQLVERLGESVIFYKIGLSLVFDSEFWPLFDWLISKGKKAFADLKVYDIPETVEASVRKLVGRGASFATVHAHEQMIRAAVRGRGSRDSLKILAVTVLTSLDNGDLAELGFPEPDVTKLVLARARRMLEVGADGVISSGLEVEGLRREHGDGFLVVVPGIRPITNADDQKRVVDVEQAFTSGADYIVVGRPIREAADPCRAAEIFQERIARVFAQAAAS